MTPSQPRPVKPVSASQSNMVQLVLPSDANTLGNALGGVVMHHMDIVAAIAAQRHAGRPCVTASVDRIDFVNPVRIGELLVLRASVNYAGRTSMEVGVRCWGEDPTNAVRHHTASAYFTFVALGPDGRPTPVPELVPGTAEEQRRFEAARRRRRLWLEARADAPRRPDPDPPTSYPSKFDGDEQRESTPAAGAPRDDDAADDGFGAGLEGDGSST